MNRFYVENEGINTYLVYSMNENEHIDRDMYDKLSGNQIKGMISVMQTEVDGQKLLKYNISSRISMEQVFSGVVTKGTVLEIFISIVEVLLNGNEYKLDSSSFVLDPQFVYVNVSTKEAEIICLPRKKNHTPVNLSNFFKNIVFKTQFDASENADYVVKMLNFLNDVDNFSLKGFENLLYHLLSNQDDMEEEAEKAAIPTTENRKSILGETERIRESMEKYGQTQVLELSGSLEEDDLEPEEETKEEVKPKRSLFHFFMGKRNKKNLEKQNSNVSDSVSEGEVKLSPRESEAYLLRVSNNDKIYITKPVFKLGTEQCYVDYYLGDNPTVSRIHANIIREGSEYYIVDMNSKNHTFVNNKMIYSGVGVKLENGSKVALSNEVFTFIYQGKNCSS